MVSDLARIEVVILDYFQSIYTSNNSSSILQDGVIDQFLGDEDANSLSLPLSANEVLKASEQMKDRKALGPDGPMTCF